MEDLGELPKHEEFTLETIRRTLIDLAEVHSRYWGDESLACQLVDARRVPGGHFRRRR